MSCWSAQLVRDGIGYIEWNMYFPNLGHNICDGHAGHLKRCVSILVNRSHCFIYTYRAVRSAEADFEHMYNVSNIVESMGNIKRTTSVVLTYEQISACDEIQNVEPVGSGFIKKYYHFQYLRPGVVKCKVKKCDEVSFTHTMAKASGMSFLFQSRDLFLRFSSLLSIVY